MSRLLVTLCTLAALTASARSAAPPSAPTPEPWTIDDFVYGESVSDFHFSPDGRWAVGVRFTSDRERNETVGHLLRLDLATGEERQLTRGNDSCTAPCWSSAGLVAFLSSRPAPHGTGEKAPLRRGRAHGRGEDESQTQAWVMDPSGGEAWPATDLARGVRHLAWAGPDALVVAASEEPTRRETRLKDEKDTTEVVEDDAHEPPVRLFRVDLKTKKITRVSDNGDRIGSLTVSRDGRWAICRHARSLRYTFDNKIKPIVCLHDLKTGRWEPIFRDPKMNLGLCVWAPDSKSFYVTNEHSSQPHLAQGGVTELYRRDAISGAEERLDLDWPRGLAQHNENTGGPCVVPVGDGFLTLLADGTRYRAARYVRVPGGWRRHWLTGEHVGHLDALQASADGRGLIYAHSTASQPVRWYRARLTEVAVEKPTPLAAPHEDLFRRRRARTEVIRWPGAHDEEVEGILSYPHEYQKGRRYPLVVLLHGGPALVDRDAWTENWFHAPNLLCQKGAFVLRPNYHGSSHYGLPWLESITQGAYIGPELIDIEKGIDALVERGLVEAGKVGLQGWSNGSILANVLTTRRHYRAAVAGAGSIEYVSDWASCEFGDAFNRFYFGRSPLEDMAYYLKKSPFPRLGRVRTPTLIFFGSEDRVVHPQQGWSHYRGLQQLGQTETRFVLFPGERHSLAKLSHQRRKLEEEQAWFDRHLFQTAPPAEVPFPADSPFAWVLKRKSARQAGGRYGLREKERLVPETVSFAGLHVGRFEVTRAQFAEFDPSPTVPGRDDYPASGISFERAMAYCAWLSRQTGRSYRLPTEKEAEDLYGRERAHENTLDRWAGYAVNPEDAETLRQKARELGVDGFLSAVGQFQATSEGVFDLGGNVAEWVRTREGKGVLRGGSADLPADGKGSPLEAEPAYRGFRVVRE